MTFKACKHELEYIENKPKKQKHKFESDENNCQLTRGSSCVGRNLPISNKIENNLNSQRELLIEIVITKNILRFNLLCLVDRSALIYE